MYDSELHVGEHRREGQLVVGRILDPNDRVFLVFIPTDPAQSLGLQIAAAGHDGGDAPIIEMETPQPDLQPVIHKPASRLSLFGRIQAPGGTADRTTGAAAFRIFGYGDYGRPHLLWLANLHGSRLREPWNGGAEREEATDYTYVPGHTAFSSPAQGRNTDTKRVKSRSRSLGALLHPE